MRWNLNRRRLAVLVVAAVAGLVLGGILAVASFAVAPATPAPSLARGPAAASPSGSPAASAAAEAAETAQAAGKPALQPAAAATAGPLAPIVGAQASAAAATPTAVPGPGTTQEAAAASRPVSILVLGIDRRPTEPAARSDTMMVLTFDPKTGTTGMISLARDLLVPIPGMSGLAKINTANYFGDINKVPGGGPELARQTVSGFLGYPIDYWVRLDFNGFRQIIDQIGGIDIDVPAPIDDPKYPDQYFGYDPLYIPAGHIHMDGALALKYARTRHEDSDYGRVRRQQQVVKAVMDKMVQPGNLARLLPRLPGLALTLGRSVQTNVPIERIPALAEEILRRDGSDPVSVVIDDKMGRNGSDPFWGFVLIPDMQKVRAAAATVFQPEGQIARGQ